MARWFQLPAIDLRDGGDGDGDGDCNVEPDHKRLALWLTGGGAQQPEQVRDRLLLGHMIAEHLPASVAGGAASASSAAAAAEHAVEVAAAQRAAAQAQAQAEAAELRGKRLEDDMAEATRRHWAELQAAQQRCEQRQWSDLQGAQQRVEQSYASLAARTSDAAEAQRAVAAVARQLDARDTEMRALIGSMQSSLHAPEVERLKEALASSQAEVAVLRGSNHVKGVLGEAAVMAVMQRTFEDWSFTDTSARGAESDFHMANREGDAVVAVEVKNKSSVTLQDVDKSVRDARELSDRLGTRLAAYLFVSVRSRNIPRKGALRLELLAGVPVLWFAVDTPEALGDELARCARVLVDVGLLVQAQRRAAEVTAEAAAGDAGGSDAVRSDQARLGAAHAALVAGVGTHLSRLDAMRRALLSTQEAATALRRQVAGMASALEAAYRDLEEAVVSAAALAPAQAAQAQAAAAATAAAGGGGGDPLACEACDKAFASSRALAAHRRHCRGKGARHDDAADA